MTKIDLRIDNRRFKRKLPDDLSKLSRKQTIAIARTYQLMEIPLGSKPAEEEQEETGLSIADRLLLLRSLLNIPEDYWMRLGSLTIESLLSDSPFRLEIKQPLTGDPTLRYVTMQGVRCYLPDKNLENSYMVQFAWAENYYRSIQSGSDIMESLNGLVSVLCTSPRRKLAILLASWFPSMSNQLINWSKKRAKKVPASTSFAVLMYYYGCRQYMIQEYRSIFSGGQSGGRRGGPDLTSKYEWWALIHDLAEKGVFGNFYATCYSNTHDVLHHVSYKSDELKEHELNRTING